MRIFNYWAIAILLGLAFWLTPVDAGETIRVIVNVPKEDIGYKIDPTKKVNLVGKDFPYWIFDDAGKVRYCMEPDRVGQIYTPCWSNGIKTDCLILHEDDGYIDCKEENAE